MKTIQLFFKRACLRVLYSSRVGVGFLSRIFFPLMTQKKVSFHRDNISWIVKEDGLLFRIFVFRRFRFYHEGLRNRIYELAAAYGIDRIAFQQGDVVIDCGANVGEIGYYFRLQGMPVRYIAVEPDDPVNVICGLNNAGFAEPPLNLVLSNANTDIDFFISTELADSSAIQPNHYTAKIKKTAKKLDALVTELNISRIKLFKVEAEGFEPEVLQGSLEALAMIQYVAIDCGPERNGKDTIVECFNILFDKGFKLAYSNFHRGTFLFEGKAAQSV